MSSSAQIAGDSARRQVQAAREFAERNGYEFAPPMKDLGVSAFKGRNRQKGALGLFLTAVKAGELRPGILVIEAVDRLSREEPLEILHLLREILLTGCQIHILTLGQTLSREQAAQSVGLLPAIVAMATLAHQESVQKSQRIGEAYVTRRKQARIGTKLKGTVHPAWFEHVYHPDGSVEYVQIPAVVGAVRRVFDLAETGMGAHAIAKVLNQTGVPVVPACLDKDPEKNAERQAKRRWFQSYVGKLVRDRRVLGEYQPVRKVGGKSVPEGDPIPGYFESIISLEQWDRVQAARNPKHGQKTGGRGLVFSNLFTGMVWCGHCANRMFIRGDYRKGQVTQRYYLRCGGQQTGGVCDNRSTPRYAWFEDKVLGALPGIPWTQLLEGAAPDQRVEKLAVQIDGVSHRIESLKQVSLRLMRVIEADDDPDVEILTRRKQVQGEIIVLTAERAKLVQERQALQTTQSRDYLVVDEVAALQARMALADTAERYEIRQRMHGLLQRVVERAEFYGGDKADGLPPTVRVRIRGGLTMFVVLDPDTPAKAGIEMGKFHEWRHYLPDIDLPLLGPSEDAHGLVRLDRREREAWLVRAEARRRQVEADGQVTVQAQAVHIGRQ